MSWNFQHANAIGRAYLAFCDFVRSLDREHREGTSTRIRMERIMVAPPIEEVDCVLHQWIDEARVFIPGSPAHRDIMCAVTTWLEHHLQRFPRPESEADRLWEIVTRERR